MTWVRWVMFSYAVAMIAMGLHGTLKAGEIMSLAGGGGIGVIVLVGLWMSLKMASPRWGYILALIVSLGAAGMFLPKFMGESGKLYPHLVIVLLSVLNVVCLLAGHLSAIAAKKKPA